MPSKLVVVESPAKAKTLSRYLGKDYLIKASMGHIRDLPEKSLAVDIENNFKPAYEIIDDKKKTVKELQSAAKLVSEVIIATDPDREGEAIAWHIAHVIKRQNQTIQRVQFHEITKKAVLDAIEHPGVIDQKLVDAQQARRVLDRLVGYLVSQQLWTVIARGLSAGRVQSVALRLIVEREQEIEAFVPEEYWVVTAVSVLEDGNQFKVKLVKLAGRDAKIGDEKTATEVTDDLKRLPAFIHDIRRRNTSQRPSPPFITSTLQQEAARRLRFPVKRTMLIAQQLYEGQELGDAGQVGLITYMRTDSTRVSNEAIAAARDYIVKEYGDDYLSPKPRIFASKKGAQDAHEAIRPTSFNWTPEKVKSFLKPQHFKLYELIWNRFMATQMADARYESVTVDVSSGRLGQAPSGMGEGVPEQPPYLLRATGRKLLFAGFRRLWGELVVENGEAGEGEGKEETTELPDVFFTQQGKTALVVREGSPTTLKDVKGEQKFTQPPPRFSESSLVKELDELGIGRPSTYAQIISTLLDRKYILDEQRKLLPTELGRQVSVMLTKEFEEVFNVEFTAHMEEALDKVEEGISWTDTVRKFWIPFKDHIDRFKEKRGELKKQTQVRTGRKCPQCGEGELVERWGRYGKFTACDNFPKCKYIEKAAVKEKTTAEPEKTGRTCPKCKTGELVIRAGRFGRFIACSTFPKCKYTEKIPGEDGKSTTAAKVPEISVPCPREGCGGTIVAKRTKRGSIFYSCTNWKEKECKVAFNDPPLASTCPECGYPIRVSKGSNLVCPECKHQEAKEKESEAHVK